MTQEKREGHKMAFNPQDHMTKMGNREYLEVKWRLVWFREVHPLGRIETDVFTVGDMIAVKAIVADAEGRILASGLSTVRDASQREATWAGRIIEKAETSAIGRALGAAGFGSQFTEDDEGDYLADSPVENKKQAPQVVQKVAGWKQGFMKYWVEQGFDVDGILSVLGVDHINDFEGEQKAATDLMMKRKKAAS
jgi:hypothetical protein